MFYLDTSFAVSAFSVEPRTTDCQLWLADNVGADLLISDWVKTEFSSALSLKIRTKDVSVEQRAEILTRWHNAAANNFIAVDIVAGHFETAARMTDNHQLSLRAGDALHIAIAQSVGAKLVTLDKRMAAAALELGVPVAAL
ncbi:MAG: type II toxin-antitoxin system VapC family toxin [Sphingorhabdus sp.]